jgi:MerR family transcriptional regulator, mercuric resistance operon regulatory protein
MLPRAFSIGEVSRQAGANVETIRYYERIGLIPAPPRRGRYRSYGLEDVRRLRFVRRARQLGFAVDRVRTLLGLATGGQAACGEARSLAASHLADVKARISDLRRMEHVLADAVRACDAGDDLGCPMIDCLRLGPSP